MNIYSTKRSTVKALQLFSVLILTLLFSTEITAQVFADAGSDQTICAGGTATIGGASTGSGSFPPFTYSWSPATGLSSSTAANPTASPTATTTYTVTVTDAMAITATDIVVVTVNSLPTATATSNSPMCDGGALSFTAATVAGGTYFWNGPNGFSSTLQNPIINPVSLAAAGTYTLTVTAMGCTNTASTIVSINPVPSATIGPFADAQCNGTGSGWAKVIATGGTPPYIYYWDDPMSQTVDSAVNLVAGTYNAYVSDVNGCNAQTSVTINEPTALTSSVFSPTMCFGDSATINPIVSGGVPPYSYVWDQGGTYYYTPTVTLSPSTSITFTLTITDANGCYTNAYPGITVSSLTNMAGYVSYSGGAFANGGTVVLYKYQPTFISFDTIQTASIDVGGLYYFYSAPAGNYIIKAFPSGSFPDVDPTYYGDTYLWESATIMSHGCTTDDLGLNIAMIETPPTSGPGLLSGMITEGPGFQRLEGDPIPGIDIKLGRNPGGQLIANTETNSSGVFTFANIPVNNAGEYYTVYVDVPGLGRDSLYTVVVDGINNTYTQLDHGIDSNSVYPIHPVVTAINNNIVNTETKFRVYPNPFKQNINVAYTLNTLSDVKIEVFNILGVKESSRINIQQNSGEYKYILSDELKPGVYFITLTVNGNPSTQRVVKSE